MANIAALLKRIESGTLSYEEKLSALSQVEQSLQDMRQKKQEAIQSNVMLIVDALKQMQVKVEQQLEEAKAIVPQKGPKGDKGDKGDRGLDGVPGKDGRNGIDGKDGKDGNDGISVTDAKIDFDGSLVITLSNGREINVGEVLPLDVSDKIKVIANGGGTSQTVVDTLTSLQNQINTLTGIDGVLGDMAQQNANNVAITGGAINGATIGATTPAAGTFTTLASNGTTILTNGSSVLSVDDGGGSASTFRVIGPTASLGRTRLYSGNQLRISVGSTNPINFHTAASSTPSSDGNLQLQVSNTASAVNYVQVTGAATNAGPIISAQGSDANAELQYRTKGIYNHVFQNGSGAANFIVDQTAGASVVNRLQASGALTNFAPRLSAVGSDTNIALAFQSKGTGAIDLAAGSSGVNISNGGTVTALTVTASGSGYTSLPTPAITAPTTAGGVQAVAAPVMFQTSFTITNGGTGYTVGDTITGVGGTFTTAWSLVVSTVSGGVITGLTTTGGFAGSYTVLPVGAQSVTGGTGTGATITINTWALRSLNITTAGSGYVEQPTVSFSGGGGSGAAAYATVGSGATVRSLGSTMSFVANNECLRITDVGGAGTAYWNFFNGGTTASMRATASSQAAIQSASAVPISFSTNASTSAAEQLRVAHTASAVNYVQVTGAATGGSVQITTQGSDNNVGTIYGNKGVGTHSFRTAGTTSIQFQITNTTNAVNRLEVTGAIATAAPVLSAQGSDTNIDLALTPKGTGNVRFGTYTGTALTIAGYIEIKDSGGTVRKLAVVA